MKPIPQKLRTAAFILILSLSAVAASEQKADDGAILRQRQHIPLGLLLAGLLPLSIALTPAKRNESQ